MNNTNNNTATISDKKALIPYYEWIEKMCPSTKEQKQARIDYLLQQDMRSHEDTYHGPQFN